MTTVSLDDLTVVSVTIPDQPIESVTLTDKTIQSGELFLGPRGPQGEKGEPGEKGDPGEDAIQFAFAFGDASPAPLALALAGRLAFNVLLVITTPFDGANPSITVGDSGDPGRLMTANENDPAQVFQYETNPIVVYPSDTQVKLFITPGIGATQGSGFLKLSLQN